MQSTFSNHLNKMLRKFPSSLKDFIITTAKNNISTYLFLWEEFYVEKIAPVVLRVFWQSNHVVFLLLFS